MKKLMISFCFLYLLCTAMTCNITNPVFPLLNFINNSDKKVSFNMNINYPDTLFCKNNGCETWGVYPHTTYVMDFYYMTREELFKKITYLQILVCSEDLDYSLPADSLRKYQSKFVLKRYQLTKHELDSMNWTIVYP